MKKLILFYLLLLTSRITYTQIQDTSSEKQMVIAQQYLTGYLKAYDPARSLELFKKCATDGNTLAMFMVGKIYEDGKGVGVNTNEAIKWYIQAGKLGYAPAWYNLGMIFKSGSGVPQNFVKSYEYFKFAADLDHSGGMLFQGNQLYKGLGCDQNYTSAYNLFQKGAKLGNIGCMYMLGLCLRNGYGIQRDSVSGNQWLTKSASMGYKQAIEEIASVTPENNIIDRMHLLADKNIQVPSSYKSVIHSAKANEIKGSYSGFLIEYDWSGKFVVQLVPLKLTLSAEGSLITGNWIEAGILNATVEAQLTDTSIYFNNMIYHHPEHYHPNAPLAWKFKSANIEILETDSIIQLAGNVHFYLPQLKEPSKPIYISLISDNPINKNQKNSIDTLLSNNSLKDLVAFPNPFSNDLTISFNLSNQCNVQVSVYNINSTIVYSEQFVNLPLGLQVQKLPLNVSTGIYIIKLVCGNTVQTTLVVKQ
jgi:uncharacterized protein